MIQSTITLLTPRGRGAVATLRFEGPVENLAGFFTAANGRPLGEHDLNRVVFGHWGREVPEDVVICRTAEDVAEIHCHGGDAAAGRILRDVESLGGRRETWPAMLERTEGKFHREWTEAVSQATTKRTAGILLRQRELFPQAIRELQSLIAAARTDWEAIRSRIESLLKWAEFGLHLTKPWEVVLGGPPNVGKSSLINALVGYARSIVYDQPGTTRDVVTAESAFEGWPVRLADTAGLREQAEPLEAEGILRAKRRLAAADCQILLIDVSRPRHPNRSAASRGVSEGDPHRPQMRSAEPPRPRSPAGSDCRLVPHRRRRGPARSKADPPPHPAGSPRRRSRALHESASRSA